MSKKGLTLPELLVAVVVTALFGLLIYYMMPIFSYEWAARRGITREVTNKEEGPFCAEKAHIGTLRNQLGSIVYCDGNLKKWTTTVGFFSWSRAEIECNRLHYAGSNEWRAPTWEELRNDFGSAFCEWPKGKVNTACQACQPCSVPRDSDYSQTPYWTSSGSNIDYKRTVWFGNGMVSEAHILQRLNVRCIEDKK